ncbi:MAG TPA: DUF6542 domain-containing protein [Rhodococcus sp. (in: high G+C Gram-positive bacteria)]|uniref:DUF6542 domain-containing protein n=1 Tax=Rhodococcus sp. SJ-3 TaxID=3454628 RepID=UPI002DB0C107|nr:DUF6542 domain-containing protein [Rhodococcus sp. (in: high G+C Gram-positive bacteria)]
MSASQRARSAVPLDMRSLVPSLPGVPWWGAPLIAVGVTLVGLLIDATGGDQLTSTFTVFYVLGCIAAVAAVRYRGLFTAMAQPPLLLLLAVPIGQEILASGSTSGLKELALNVAYPLVNRFPAMLLATVAVLVIGAARIFLAKQNVGVRARAPRSRRAAPARSAATARRRSTAKRPVPEEPNPAEAPRKASSPRTSAVRGPSARAEQAEPPRAKASVRDVADSRGRAAAPRRRSTPPPASDPVARATPAPRRGDIDPRRDAPQRRRPRPEEASLRTPQPTPMAGAPRQVPGYRPPVVRYRDRVDD